MMAEYYLRFILQGNMMLSLIIVYILTLLLIIIPGKIITNRLFFANKIKNLEKFSLYFIFGIVFLTLLGLTFNLLGLNLRLITFFIIVYLIFFIINRKKIKVSFQKKEILLLIIILVLSLMQSTVLLIGNLKSGDRFFFPSIHDNMWNIAILNEIQFRVPPQNPAINSEILKNHHYFYQIFLNVIRNNINIDVFDLYYRVGPIIISISYGFALYLVSMIFCNSYFSRILVIIFGYLSGSFAYLLPVIFRNNIDWKSNTFFSDQPFDQLFNPYSVFGYVLMLFTVYLYFRLNNEKKINSFFIFLTSLLISVIFGFKSFGGLIVVLSIILTEFSSLLIYKKSINYKLLIIVILLFIPVFTLITKPGSVSMKWYPGWILTEMVVGEDKLNLPKLAEIETYYRNTNQIKGLIKIKSIEFIIYFIGNLGTRLLGLLTLVYFIIKKDDDFSKKRVLLFCFFCFLTSFSIPLLFNLGSNAHNIVQFTPYGFVILSIFTAIMIDNFLTYLKQRKKSFIASFFLIFIIIISIPVNIKNFVEKIKYPPDFLEKEEIFAMDYMKNNLSRDYNILIDTNQFRYDPIYIAAFSEKKIFLSSPSYAKQTGVDYRHHLKLINDQFYGQIDTVILKNNNIKFIYLLKKNDLDNQRRNVVIKNAISDNKLKIIFENSKATIYEVI
jgi:hypothetical protein